MGQFWPEVLIESLVGILVYIFLHFSVFKEEGIMSLIIFCILIILFFLFVNGGIRFFNFLDDTTN